MVLGKIIGGGFGLLALALPLFAQESEMEKRWKTQSMERDKPADLGSKSFASGKPFTDKSFETSKSGLQKDFSTKAFNTAAFVDQKDAKAAQRTFQTSAANQQEIKFITQPANSQDKNFATRNFSDQAKVLSGSDRSVESQKFTPEAKTPGNWKAFRETLKKELSMEEVRELLNKPPSN